MVKCSRHSGYLQNFFFILTLHEHECYITWRGKKIQTTVCLAQVEYGHKPPRSVEITSVGRSILWPYRLTLSIQHFQEKFQPSLRILFSPLRGKGRQHASQIQLCILAQNHSIEFRYSYLNRSPTRWIFAPDCYH